jgi:hypothetical protein
MKALDIQGDPFHPEWNYTVGPRTLDDSQRLLFGASLARARARPEVHAGG